MDEESAGGGERARARGRGIQVRSGAGSASSDDELAFEIAPVAARLRGGELVVLVGRADRAEPATALSADRADPIRIARARPGFALDRDGRGVHWTEALGLQRSRQRSPLFSTKVGRFIRTTAVFLPDLIF